MSDLEVDSTSKSLVASWFGVNTLTETTENDFDKKYATVHQSIDINCAKK